MPGESYGRTTFALCKQPYETRDLVMDGHLSMQQVEGYRRRTLSERELLLADRHLGACGECRRHLRLVAALPEPPAFARELEAPLHLSYEQMCSYIDGKLDSAQKDDVENHTSICTSCAQELADLQSFESKLSPSLSAQPEPAKASAQVEPAGGGLRRWLSEFFAAPQRLRFVGASLAMMIVGFLALGGAGVSRQAVDASTSLAQYRELTMAHPGVFVGAFLLIGAGIIGVLYGLFRRY